MKFKIRRCTSCHRYTLKNVCPACSSPTENPQAPRFSPRDPYGTYRRLMKKASKGRRGSEK
ncbi:MAG TPA: RNA-protein complex protein Nop10 [Candidatus Methanoperedenaceae archaeon]|nr:RNA-protein complex protein Nop10 [Candidatus Methanoperedenaceae archaeon]